MGGIINGIVWAILWLFIVSLTLGVGLLIFIPYLLFTFTGANKRLASAKKTLNSTLMSSENIISESIQKRVFALWGRRKVLAITQSRIIIVDRGVLGGFKMKDIQWKDLSDAKLNQNVLPNYCGSNLMFKHSMKGGS